YGTLKAICIFPVFLFVPGYVIAWLLDLFEFRGRTAAFRITLSVPLSISLCPILTYLLARFAGMAAVWVFYSAAAAAFLVVLAFAWKGKGARRLVPAGSAIFGVILCVWLVVSVLSLIDLQIGDRLYYPTSTLDYAVRTSFTHSISATGVPPQNPLFQPGNPAPLRYHYFWLLMCSLVNQAGGPGITARLALIGGTFWCGIGLMALVLIYLRIFTAGRPERFRRRALAGVLLLAVTGLDIVPSLGFLFLYAKGLVPFVLPSVEWWNEHVDWFVYSTIWAPHAVAATIACFMGFLLLWHAPAAQGRRGLLRYSLPAGIALASSVGCSIYVTLVFAIFLIVWTLVTLGKRWFRETAALAVAGLAMIVLAIPYLRDLSGPAAGGPLVQLTVRAFSLAALFPTPGLSQGWRQILVNGSLLPINYLLEFGFFFLVAHCKWRQHRASGNPLSRQDLAFALMAATSLLVCTFLRSSVIGCNDLGWRGFLVAEFVLLLWGVDVFTRRDHWRFLTGRQRDLLVVFIGLGVAGTVYDLAIVRAYPLLADRGLVPALDWMSGDRSFGKRTYAARSAYEWLRTATPPT
ncbi:MAG TPA: hypothetical protein VKJ01_01335, partial [Candidatus Solibacter sp.]|nr:hypothetical protein [Candidatus Solibacter sp.]